MSQIHLNRDQQRRMQKLTDQVDLICVADRRFFERFPNRHHRVRLASRAEVEQQTILHPVWMPPGCATYVAVRNIASGVRLRMYIRGLIDAETDLTEEMARAIFERSATPRTREIEAQLRKAAEVRP